jgi:nitrilase
MSEEGALGLSQVHACESGTFVFLASCVMSVDGAKRLGLSDEMLEKSFFTLPGGGASRVFGPDGRLLAGSELADHEEGIVQWDVDLNEVLAAKTLMDGIGHYSRPDLLRCVIPLFGINKTDMTDQQPASGL